MTPGRSFFLFLSRNGALRHWMESSSLGQRLSSRFVAGEHLHQALAVCRRIQSQGIAATLDHLGENVTRIEEASASRDECLLALQRLKEAGLEDNVSIKLSQFGIDLDEDICRRNVGQVVRAAAAQGGFVRIDMESSEYTGRTLRLVTDLHAQHGGTGAVIQAYLHRSEKDVEMLCGKEIRVRLCKGAYLEPPSVAFEKKEEVDRNFVLLMKKLLVEGAYPAIATHDESIIQEALRFVAAGKIPADRFEFQMLYGIRRDLQRRLAKGGYRVRLYVPYGKAWYPYFMRRLAERPANALFLIRNLPR